MVGVPGRSKGCSTCRKRRKGCDQKRPVCTQCSQLGIECGGYERKAIFLNHTPQGPDANAKPFLVVYQKEAKPTLPITTDVAIPNSLARSAYREKYISIWMNKYHPTQRYVTGRYSDPSGSWMTIAHGFHTSDKAAQLSLLSFGLFAVGETQHAIQAYGGALHQFNVSLRNPRRAQEDSTLAICQLLALLELFYGAERDVPLQGVKWQNHLDGLLAIILSRSPYTYQSGASHRLFADARYPLLLSAITHKRRFPLNSPEWRTIPWELESKSSADKLYDIVADLTHVLADMDEMRCCTDPIQKAGLREKLLAACWRVERSLQFWLEESGPVMSFHDSHGRLVEPTSASDVSLAHTTLLYWTAYILLYATIIPVHDPSLSAGTEIPTHIDPRPYLRCAAHALPYFWRPSAGLSGAYLATTSFGVCMHICYAWPDRYADMLELMGGFIMESGPIHSILPFLTSLQRGSGVPEMANTDGIEGLIIRAQKWVLG